MRYYCNKYVGMWKQLWNWVIVTCWKNFEVQAGNVDVKDNSGESQMKIRNMLLEAGGKEAYQLAKNLPELCSGVLWKLKLVSNEIDI